MSKLFKNRPLNLKEDIEKETPQYSNENLSLAERVKRLEEKVFGV